MLRKSTYAIMWTALATGVLSVPAGCNDTSADYGAEPGKWVIHTSHKIGKRDAMAYGRAVHEALEVSMRGKSC